MRQETAPQIIYQEGKPVAVILDIDEYQQILQRLEDTEDLKLLEEMRERPLNFRSLEEFLAEYSPSV